jgi:hypothetical protein
VRLEEDMLRLLQSKGTMALGRQDLSEVLRAQRIPFDPHTVGLLWRELEPSNKQSISIAQFSKRLRWLRRGLHMASTATGLPPTRKAHHHHHTRKQHHGQQKQQSAAESAQLQREHEQSVAGLRKTRQNRSHSSVLPHSGSDCPSPASVRSRGMAVAGAADVQNSAELAVALAAGLASPEEELKVLQQHVRALFDLTLQQADLNADAGRLGEAKGMANALLLEEGLLTYMNDRLRLKVSALRKRCSAIVERCDQQAQSSTWTGDASLTSSSPTSSSSATAAVSGAGLEEQLARAERELHKWCGRAKKVQHQLEKEQRERKEAVRDLQVAHSQLEGYREREYRAQRRRAGPNDTLVDTVYADENRDLLPKRRPARQPAAASVQRSAPPPDEGGCACAIM